jgi:spermidine synthase
MAVDGRELSGEHHPSSSWPFALYALTGFAGLLAEQGFEKYTTLLTGATASGAAVVIFSYFLGFAGGSALAGAWLERGTIRRPLRTYGTIELLVGVSCVAFAFGFHRALEALGPLQGQFSSPLTKFLARFVFGSILILPTATLMGASFPLIAHVVDPDDGSGGKRWARAYAVNLAGACGAALLGPYFILPSLGVRGSLWLCFATTLFVFAVTRLLRDLSPGMRSSLHEGPRRALDADAWLLLAAAFGSGVIFFVSEVLWTHLIGAVLGSSIYAFSSMLLMVIAGLTLGAWRVQRSTARATFFLLQCCALAVLVQFRLWDLAQLAFLFPPVYGSFFVAEAFKLLITAALIVPSATMLGTIFPSLLASPTLRAAGRMWLLGLMNTANAVGCLSGALLGVFVMLPLAGSEVSLKMVILILVAGSLLFLWRARPPRAVAAAVLMLALFTVVCVGWWHWDRRILTSGLNVYFGAERAFAEPRPDATSQILFFHESAQGGITTVVESTGAQNGRKTTARTLLTNGKFQGNDLLEGEGQAQIGFSLIPSQFVQRFDRALLIGLGTGHTALALRQLGYKEVDVAEYSPGIVEAAATYFGHLNENVLSDPRVRLALEDGRNLLLTDPARTYDLITAEITSIWFAGATNIYAKEFYELAKRRLAPGGVLQQWVQLHHIGHDEVASVIATARAVFPYVSLWYFGRQGMIVASDRPQELETGRKGYLASRLDRGEERTRIEGARVMRTEAVDAMIHQLRPVINTDHNRWIEYATPRYNVGSYDWRTDNLAFFTRF